MSNKKINSEIGRTAIDEKVKLKLWAISGGRCELCNRLLYEDLVFGTDGNFSEIAHIHAVSLGGPRNKIGMTLEEKNDINNLMLLCEEHHHMIDTYADDYKEGLLLQMKLRHEARIRNVTNIPDNQSCRIVAFFSNIDHQEDYCSERLFKDALLASGKLSMQQPIIKLNADSCIHYEGNKDNFELKAKELETQFKIWFDEIIKTGDSIGVFSLAPQPLLFKLGTLINDQYNTYVYQCHRTGHKWAWKNNTDNVEYEFLKSTAGSTKIVALVIDLSAPIVDDRIISVLGNDATIFHLTINTPNRNFVTNEFVQDEFIKAFRNALEVIKNLRPAPSIIHVFPAMPNSLAIKAGMDYMPKADLPLILYEQEKAATGFFESITIGG